MTDIASLRSAEEQLQQAQLASDVAALDLLLHPGVTYVGPDGVVVGKEADLDAHRTGAIRLDTLDPLDLAVGIRDGVGVTVLTARLVGHVGSQPFEVRMVYTRTWALGPTGWRVVAAHASAIS